MSSLDQGVLPSLPCQRATQTRLGGDAYMAAGLVVIKVPLSERKVSLSCIETNTATIYSLSRTNSANMYSLLCTTTEVTRE